MERAEDGSENKKRTLSLYSQDIERHLWIKLELLKQLENPNIEQKLSIAQLDRNLSNTPSEYEIPKNIVLVGTLNSDETTYDLSPKVIDRSYVITYPPADLSSILTKNSNNISEQLSIGKFQQKISQCIKHIENSIVKESESLSDRISNNWHKDWKKIITWNDKYISQLGIPIGYRVRRDYKFFYAVCHCLGVTNSSNDNCLAYFLFAKLLPRISFIKDRDKKLENLCQKWIDEIRQDYAIGGESYVLEQLEQQIRDSGRRNIRYWG